MAKADTTQPSVPTYNLVVVHPFGDYQRGDKITDPAAIATVLGSENAQNCHKIIPQ